ncbi:hypothetical protein SODALDRAFT_273124 [Sodiomyces alkalinus F11]|uniref:SPX domain-containing protein n=1 Tax=Sodiomyces alkalinus (strain CBS 110278 / VKM F-3762 / F11) TaxID=1314773 RepID=A0A3N2Q3Q5_SODAK|nr:hypothetical protein SODALDRAFT_273124 [Sodiomyces alkalinus F11]ROT41401.1 hypothetical protein SODALDRAFT_273124 [Sodiomyces alkalinus F11]
MKFGEKLEQESVPEWSLYNVDYNSLKHEIKVHTSRHQATAVTIPGQRDSPLEKFEEKLYLELCNQHDRVDLFVNSKAGEISRRLDSVSGQIQRLVARCNRHGTSGITLKRQRRLAKYERELLRCEEDILAVSRFINAQVTAFRKITKKYRKWTGSATLGSRFRQNVLSNPKSFTRRDLTPLQRRYDDILATMRNATSHLSEPSSPSCVSPQLSSRQSPQWQGDAETQDEDRRPNFGALPEPDHAPQQPAPTHYWNEYDDGSDAEQGAEGEEYAIYINPDADEGIPGLRSVRKILQRPLMMANLWFSRRHRDDGAAEPARGSLLPHRRYQDEDDSSDDNRGPRRGYGGISPFGAEADDEEYATSEDNLPLFGYNGYYAALPSLNDQRAARYRERALAWGTLGSFAASFVLLAVAGVLIATGRHRLRVEVDAGVTVGAVASLFCACLALGMALYRNDRLGLVYQFAVWIGFTTACVLNGTLLVLVVSN